MNLWLLFLLLSVLCVYGALVFVLPVMVRSGKQSVDSDVLNTRLYKDKLAELQQDLANNEIDEEQFKSADAELKKQLLQDAENRGEQFDSGISEKKRYQTLAAIALGTPLLAFLLYFINGQPQYFKPVSQNPHTVSSQSNSGKHPATNKQPASQKQAGLKPPSVDKVKVFITRLKKELESNPKNTTNWIMLAKSYAYIKDHQNAVATYEKAMQIIKNNADLITDYADQLAVVHGGKLEGKPYKQLQKALKINPNHKKALHLIGTHYYRKGDYKSALTHWRKLYNLLPQGSNDRKIIQGIIDDAHNRMGVKGNPDKSTVSKHAAAFVISGTVTLDEKLKSQLKGTETLFIFAQAASGPKMPLAAIKKKASDLPYSFTMDDSNAMSPAFKLSKFNKVKIIARIVKGQGVSAKPGDIQGESPVISKGQNNKINITIGTVIK